jgi:hypothetical protein
MTAFRLYATIGEQELGRIRRRTVRSGDEDHDVIQRLAANRTYDALDGMRSAN